MSQFNTIPTLLRYHAESNDQHEAFSGPGWEITYAELERTTRNLATHLTHSGIRRGHFVAVVLGRCLQAVESILAVVRAGAVVVPLDPRSPSSELQKIFAHCDARFIITDDRFLPNVCAAAAPGSTIVLTSNASIVDVAFDGGFRIERYQDWIEDDVQLNVPKDIDIDELGENEDAFVHYTSGITGEPKGVLSSQKSWLQNARHLASVMDHTHEDKIFWPLPLFHAFGHSFCILSTLVTGCSAHLMDPEGTVFDSLADPRAKGTTIIAGAPATFLELIEASQNEISKSVSLPKLRICMYAGSPASSTLSEQIQELLGVALINNYGCTEACGAIAITKPNDVSCGNPLEVLSSWEVRVTGIDGSQVPDGEQGELWLRGSNLMTKYYRESTNPFTADGWFATGDIATVSRSTADIELTLVGRHKETIIRGGQNIHPKEVEGAILLYPGIKDVAVTGIQHKLFGEVPAAFIVKPGDVDLNLAALIAVCRKALPDYKIPTAFYEIDSVPRTLLGKPKRLALKTIEKKPLSVRSRLQSRLAIESLVLDETAGACGLHNEDGSSDSNFSNLRQHFDQPFAFLGLGSMAGVVLRDRLASLTGVQDLPNTLVFDYPTPLAVSQYLYDRLLKVEKPPSPPSTPNLSQDDSVEPIAIISMACKYPGGVASPEDLWNLVYNEIDATSDFPDDRGWDVDTLYNTDPDVPRSCTTKRGGFLRDFADFDAGLFGMAPREALATDPQQRLLLESTWELAERGGIAPSSLQGTQTGVYIGVMYDDYESNGVDNLELEAHLGLGSSGSVVSGRVSYCFGLHGPSLAVSTGCSSSMVAIHLAAQALRNNECSLAIAGGVTTMATPQPFTMFSKRRGLSSDGRCRAFSSDAAGTGWAEGVGLVLLERYSEAKRNGHQIHALIRGSAINSDGTSNGFAAPSTPAQIMCIESALGQAGLSPADIDVLEGHGTATALGDPIEIQAVIETYGNGSKYGNSSQIRRTTPLLLGSVKSNIGHTQAAAAIAGIIKMAHGIQHSLAPKSLHIREPSTHIDWNGCGVELLSSAKEWPSVDRPRRAAVSSFGIGGTNSHIILEEAQMDSLRVPDSNKSSVAFPWIISAADENALRAQARSLLVAWHKSVGILLRDQDPTDVAFSLATSRSALQYRASINYKVGIGFDKQIQTTLGALERGEPHPDIATCHTGSSKPRVACLFSGQGSRLPSMDVFNELCSTFNVFSKAFKQCCDAVDKHLDCQLVCALVDDKLRDRTDFAQSALFVFEVAMFRLLQSFNIHPDFVTGHSLGEVVAAHAAGALSLDSAATIVTARAKLMAGLPPNGGMVSISATEKEVAEEISRSKSTAVIAVVNSHDSMVVSGTEDAVKAIAHKFESEGKRTTVLKNIKHGFHSPLMDDILPDLEQALESPLKCAEAASIPLVSTVTAQQEDAEQLISSKHWTRHVREPVQFSAAVDELRLKQDVSLFVEVGPSAMLSTHVTGAISTHGTVDRLLNTIGQIWTRGISVNWSAVFEGSGGRFVSLPVYAFQRQKYWLPYNPRSRTLSREAAPGQGTAGVPRSELGHGMLINSTSFLGTGSIICFGSLSKARQPWLWDHIISGQSLLPATAFAELAMRAGMECEYQVESESMELEELAVVKPLILSSTEDDSLNKEESEEVQVQVLVGEPQTTGNGTLVSRDVSVYSRPSGVAARHEWTRHATGTLKQSPIASNTKMGLENDTNRTDSESDVNVRGMYKVLADAGIYYGQPFQAIRSIWRLEGEDLLVHIDPPHKSSDNSSFIIHPAVLDAALHASVIASADKVGTGGIKLPFSMRGFQVFEKPDVSDSILSTVSHLGEDRIRVRLANKSTSVVFAEIDEVHLRAWKSDIAGGDLYRLEWVQSVSESAVSDNTMSIYEKFRVPGSGGIDAAGVSKAVHDAIAEALHVIHERRETLTSAFNQDVLVFVTERATSVGNRSDIDVVAAAVWGFVRSAQAEFGGDRIMLVDLDGSTESEAAVPVAIASGQETIALQSGTMMVPKLVKQPPILDALHSSTLDVRGTVLITGGTGGLGAILSRYLVHTYGAKNLILASRSGMKAPTARELYSELSDAGATVRVEACDISNREELAVILSTVHPLPPITSIIHCAGVVDDALLSWQTSERISQVLRPKVDGAWNLHELMPSTVHSFVLFSSYVSILGNEGQAAYTAGNSFLDALARFRVARGLPALSLAWGPWANDEGMAAPGKLVAPNPRVANAQPVTDEQGMQLFFRALQVQAKTTPPEPVIVPMLLRGPFPLVQTVDFLAKQKDVSSKPHTESEATWRQSLVGVSIEDRHDILLALLKEEVAAVLGYQKDILLPDRPLVELGFDSFTSVLLTNRLKILTGFSSIPVTLALDYDTLQALVQYLLARFDAEPVAEVGISSDVPSIPNYEPDINDTFSGTTENVSPTADTVLPIRAAEDRFNPDAFRCLSPLYKQLSDLGYYTAAIDLLAVSSLALPTFKIGTDLSRYGEEPRRLATCTVHPSSADEEPFPLVFISPFFPQVTIEGAALSVYKAVASGMSGERDVFELSHPEGHSVPEDHGALAELHLCTIRKHFSNRKGIILAGYSAGGTVAYAVASKLFEAGGLPRLAGFIMIDTYLNMVGRGDPEWLSALPAEALLSRLSGSRVDDSGTPVSESLVGDLGLALAKAGGYFKTFTGWNADLYPLPNELQTLFIRAGDRSEKMPEDENVWRAKWPLAKKTVDVPGTHLALLDKSFAPAISEEIQKWAKENLG